VEENKTLIVIVAVVAIVAIFSLAFTGRVTSIEKSATQNLVGEAIRNNIEPNCECTGAQTSGFVFCFNPCNQCCPILYPGSIGFPVQRDKILLPPGYYH